MPALESREQEMSVNPSSLAAQEASTSSKGIYSVSAFRRRANPSLLYVLLPNLSVIHSLFLLMSESLGHLLLPNQMDGFCIYMLWASPHSTPSHGGDGIPNHSKPTSPSQVHLSECFQVGGKTLTIFN